MNCAEFLRALDAEGAALKNAAASHARECASCRRALARFQAMQTGMRAMNEEPLPPFLHARLMAHIRAERQKSGAWSLRLRWLTPALIAACVALVVGYGVWRTPQSIETDRVAAPQIDQKSSPSREYESSKNVPAPTAIPESAGESSPMKADEYMRSEKPLVEREIRAREETRRRAGEQLGFAPEPEARDDLDAESRPLAAARPQSPAASFSDAAAPGVEAKLESQSKERKESLRSLGYLGEQAASALPAAPAQTSGLAPVKKSVAGPRSVACSVRLVDGDGAARTIVLAAESAPPVGEAWIVTIPGKGKNESIHVAESASVDEQTRNRVDLMKTQGAESATIQTATRAGALDKRVTVKLTPELSERLRGLPPGRYLLRRASENY